MIGTDMPLGVFAEFVLCFGGLIALLWWCDTRPRYGRLLWTILMLLFGAFDLALCVYVFAEADRREAVRER